jgi:hypothetical protein
MQSRRWHHRLCFTHVAPLHLQHRRKGRGGHASHHRDYSRGFGVSAQGQGRGIQHRAIRILGNLVADRLSIVSFIVQYSEGILHHGFVSTLLNDLFGIQSRGGCSCAGPYGHALLGIGEDDSRKLADAISAGYKGLSPGWVRLNFNYFISETVFKYLLDAVDFVANHGHAFLPHYRFDMMTGHWIHRRSKHDDVRLDALPYASVRSKHRSKQDCFVMSSGLLAGHIAAAHRLVPAAPSTTSILTSHDLVTITFDNVDPFPVPGDTHCVAARSL